jgi:hypothetical protein
LFPLICAVVGSACIGGGAMELGNTLRERAFPRTGSVGQGRRKPSGRARA